MWGGGGRNRFVLMTGNAKERPPKVDMMSLLFSRNETGVIICLFLFGLLRLWGTVWKWAGGF